VVHLHGKARVALGTRWTAVMLLLSFAFVSDLSAATEMPQEGMSGFQFAKILGFGFGVLTLGIILYVLVYHRGTPLGQTARWLHLLSLCVIPVFLLFLGNLVAFEGSKKVAFCGSCHPVMGPYVDDLNDPNSISLAAIHQRINYVREKQCYACHVGYGLAGTIGAKIDGLAHMFHYFTGTYTQPIKLWRPYNSANCLSCHTGSRAFEKESVHVSVMSAMKTNKASCLFCHAEAHFQPAANVRE